MIIREFKRPDLKRVLEIELSSFDDPYPSNVLVDLYNLGAGFLVAQEDNIVVGYIIFWIRFEDEGHIISLAVDQKYYRKKIGSQLVETALEIFKRYNVNSIRLEVRKENREARKFYQKLGFVEKAHLVKYYEDGEDAVVMGKLLEDFD
ncbi:ribosomal protein S18-alanine N-acetyltransferase [Methanobacterium formicicum]|uniref:Ribosomal-protein-alanine acetyltransferase n=1 Tax=Methanobacterium formicicum (strain DSM 3637 / PP1) TaxID=1204725 RepID=K2RA08_METFP|nr:ribosomal protein S18-alanine N-acetyltransferase [Methanobacterium formicicum]EKF85164.1 ribosomal-protein-alanine acetyltransferase [Methanobacterium formicicum DSM 3637]